MATLAAPRPNSIRPPVIEPRGAAKHSLLSLSAPCASFPPLTGSLFSGRFMSWASPFLVGPRHGRAARRGGRPCPQACSDGHLLLPVDVVGVEPGVGVRVGEVLKRERHDLVPEPPGDRVAYRLGLADPARVRNNLLHALAAQTLVGRESPFSIGDVAQALAEDYRVLGRYRRALPGVRRGGVHGVPDQDCRSLVRSRGGRYVVDRVGADLALRGLYDFPDEVDVVREKLAQAPLPLRRGDARELLPGRLFGARDVGEPPDLPRLPDQVAEERPLAEDEVLRVGRRGDAGAERVPAEAEQARVAGARRLGVHHPADARVDAVGADEQVAFCLGAVLEAGDHPAVLSD